MISDWSQFDLLLLDALTEDAVREDVTTRALIPPSWQAEAEIVAARDGVICGLGLLSRLCLLLPRGVECRPLLEDGDPVQPGSVAARMSGPAETLLGLERTALNFLQRLSGIATLTGRYVEAVAGSGASILDTRKTTPGWRALEKYAVRCGGGVNHRMNLGDQAMIKENHLHLVARHSGCDAVAAASDAVARLRAKSPGVVLTVEIETIPQLRAVLDVEPDIVLLDNMTPNGIRRALECIDRVCAGGSKTRPQVEVSGGVSLDNIRGYAMPGVDRISIGALTHSAPALDLSMNIDSAGA